MSLDILKAVNKIQAQQGQSQQTVRDVGSWIIHTANVNKLIARNPSFPLLLLLSFMLK